MMANNCESEKKKKKMEKWRKTWEPTLSAFLARFSNSYFVRIVNARDFVARRKVIHVSLIACKLL